jgi:hypothetical protein
VTSRAASRAAALMAVGATLVAVVSSGAPAAAATGPEGLAQTARLQGQFTATGTVLSAVNVPGERRGQQVTRTWTFAPRCPAGACATVELTRQRGTSNQDLLLLLRQRPGYYKGAGVFTVPVRCGTRIYRNGARAKYTITLTITSAVAAGNTADATGFTANYRNPSRTGLTPCYSAPSYDAARYVGAPTPPPPPSGATRSERSTRLSTGSCRRRCPAAPARTT